MSKVKYIRTSTLEQNTSRQEINASSFSQVYIDKCSGAIKMAERKEGKKLIKKIEQGIITEVHVCSIDRLGRNTLDVLTILEFFNQRGINLFIENIGMYSLLDSKIPNPSFKMIISVLGNVAEMERNFIRERQKQGIAIAKAKGKYTGRLYGSRMTEQKFLDKYKVVAKELQAGQSLRRAAALGKTSLGTAQRIQKILNMEAKAD